MEPTTSEQKFEMPEYLTVQEVMDVLRVSKMTVLRLIHADVMPGARFGRSIRIPKKGFERFLADAERLRELRDYSDAS